MGDIPKRGERMSNRCEATRTYGSDKFGRCRSVADTTVEQNGRVYNMCMSCCCGVSNAFLPVTVKDA